MALCPQASTVTTSAARAAGDPTAPSPAAVRTGDPAPLRMAPVTVLRDTEGPCAREVRFPIAGRSKAGRNAPL